MGSLTKDATLKQAMSAKRQYLKREVLKQIHCQYLDLAEMASGKCD